jgi:hypothetical protein
LHNDTPTSDADYKISHREFALCGPRRVPQNSLLTQCRPVFLQACTMRGGVRVRDCVPSNGTKELLHREHGGMFARIGMSVHAELNTKVLQIGSMERQRKVVLHEVLCGADKFGGMTPGVAVRRNIDGVALVASGFTFH